MFVQSAEDIRVDATKSTLRLVKVNPQTVYFGRAAGAHAGNTKMATHDDVEGGAGRLQRRSANATFRYTSGARGATLVVVTLTKPVVDGADLLYTYKIVEGTMSANGGATSLFIDWYGVGGGVGPGFHGVGVRATRRRRACQEFCV